MRKHKNKIIAVVAILAVLAAAWFFGGNYNKRSYEDSGYAAETQGTLAPETPTENSVPMANSIENVDVLQSDSSAQVPATAIDGSDLPTPLGDNASATTGLSDLLGNTVKLPEMAATTSPEPTATTSPETTASSAASGSQVKTETVTPTNATPTPTDASPMPTNTPSMPADASAAPTNTPPMPAETSMPGTSVTTTNTASGKGKDQYNTDPVPEGKPLPIEPDNATIGDESFTVTLTVRCDMILSNMNLLNRDKHELVPSNGIIFSTTKVTAYEGESVFNVLQREMRRAKIHIAFRNTPIYNSAYIEAINNLYEFDVGELSGWMYCVNNWYPNYGCSRYQLNPGDTIEWNYTCDLGRDLGQHWINGKQQDE